MTGKTVKKILKFVVGWCTSFTVANFLRQNTATQGKVQEIELWVGSVAVGAVAAEAAEQYIDTFVDKFNNPDPS